MVISRKSSRKLKQKDNFSSNDREMQNLIMQKVAAVRLTEQLLDEMDAIDAHEAKTKLKLPKIPQFNFEMKEIVIAELLEVISEANAEISDDEEDKEFDEKLAKAQAELEFNQELANNPKEHLAIIKAEIAEMQTRKTEIEQRSKDIDNLCKALFGDRKKE